MQRPSSALTRRSFDEVQDSSTQSHRQTDLEIPQTDNHPNLPASSLAYHSARGAKQPEIREEGSSIFLKADSANLFPSMTTVCMSYVAAFSSTVFATMCLGWAVYSRSYRSKLETWTDKVAPFKPFTSSTTLSNTSEGSLGNSKAAYAANSRLSESHPAPRSDSYSALGIDGGARTPVETGCKLPSISRTTRRSRHYDRATHEKLRKHYDYLLSWVSNQHDNLAGSDQVDDTATASDNHLTDEFREMSLRHFTDLSCVIYQDVRRRENDGSPERAQPSKFEPWTRNKQNESRMVLCRTINEQFSRLVTALVFEQARRLAELRIRMQRHDLVTK